MKKNIIALKLLFIAFTLTKTEMKGQEYKLYVAPASANIIQLKWMSKKINIQSSFDIYRKESDHSTWKKINEKPIQRITPLNESELNKLEEKENNYALAHYSSAFSDNAKEDEENYHYLLLSAVSDNKLAEYCGIYFQDKDVIPNKTYTYKLTDVTGKELAISGPINLSAEEKLNAIDNLQIRSGNMSAELNWNYNPKYQLYKIYRSDNIQKYFLPTENDIKVSQSNQFPYVDKDTNLVVGKSYSYQAVGIDFFGRETPKSNTISITIKDLTPPPAAQGLRVAFREPKYFHITWKEVDHRYVSETNLYKSKRKNGNYQKVYSGEALEYDDKDIQDATDYYYVLEAINKNGIPAYTDTVRGNVPDLTPPAIPTNIQAIADTGYIKISWEMNKEPDIKGYFVFRGLSSDESNFTPLFDQPITINYFEDKHPKEIQNKIVYKICAVDNNYNRSKYSEPIYIQMPDITPPASSSFLDIQKENNKLTLSWSKVHDLDFKEYELQRGSPIDDSTYGNYTTLIRTSQTSFTDIHIESNKQYQYALSSLDQSGNRSEVRYREVFTKQILLPEKIDNFAVQKFEKTVKLTWNNPQKVPIKVLRKEGLGTFIPVSLASNGSEYEDSDTKANATYIYKLVTEGEDDDWESQELKIEF